MRIWTDEDKARVDAAIPGAELDLARTLASVTERNCENGTHEMSILPLIAAGLVIAGDWGCGMPEDGADWEFQIREAIESIQGDTAQ